MFAGILDQPPHQVVEHQRFHPPLRISASYLGTHLSASAFLVDDEGKVPPHLSGTTRIRICRDPEEMEFTFPDLRVTKAGSYHIQVDITSPLREGDELLIDSIITERFTVLVPLF